MRLYLIPSLAIFSGLLFGQGIDCSKAAASTESLICSEPELRSLDQRMAELYGKIFRSMPAASQAAFRTEQRGWLRSRDACASVSGSHKDCVVFSYRQRIERLKRLQDLPDKFTPTIYIAPYQTAVESKGTVIHRETTSYTVSARQGQMLGVSLDSEGGSLHFNVFREGEQQSIYSSEQSTRSNRAKIRLPADGDYRIHVYAGHTAAPEGRRTPFTLKLSLE